MPSGETRHDLASQGMNSPFASRATSASNWLNTSSRALFCDHWCGLNVIGSVSIAHVREVPG